MRSSKENFIEDYDVLYYFFDRYLFCIPAFHAVQMILFYRKNKGFHRLFEKYIQNPQFLEKVRYTSNDENWMESFALRQQFTLLKYLKMFDNNTVISRDRYSYFMGTCIFDRYKSQFAARFLDFSSVPIFYFFAWLRNASQYKYYFECPGQETKKRLEEKSNEIFLSRGAVSCLARSCFISTRILLGHKVDMRLLLLREKVPSLYQLLIEGLKEYILDPGTGRQTPYSVFYRMSQKTIDFLGKDIEFDCEDSRVIKMLANSKAFYMYFIFNFKGMQNAVVESNTPFSNMFFCLFADVINDELTYQALTQRNTYLRISLFDIFVVKPSFFSFLLARDEAYVKKIVSKLSFVKAGYFLRLCGVEIRNFSDCNVARELYDSATSSSRTRFMSGLSATFKTAGYNFFGRDISDFKDGKHVHYSWIYGNCHFRASSNDKMIEFISSLKNKCLESTQD